MKSKYVRPMPEISVEGYVRGGRTGPRTAADKRALIFPQAQTIIAKFGGPRELARVLKEVSDDPNDHYHPSTIYRWMYPQDVGGTGGEIPLPALKTILKAARVAGVMLTADEIYPEGRAI
jgi:hypothetical protein